MNHNKTYVGLDFLNLSNYEISQSGDVRNISRQRSLSQQVNKAGVKYVGLTNDDQTQVTYSVARLVLLSYIGESSDPRKKYAIHKDGDRKNVRLSNLKWATKSEVIYYMKSYAKALENSQYTDVQIEELTTGTIFRNSLEAAVATGVAPTDIYHLAVGYNGIQNQGFKFITKNR